MAKGTTRTSKGVLDGARERFEEAWENAQSDWKRLQKDAEKRRSEIEATVERQVKRLRAELKKSPLVQRAEELRKEAEDRAERFRAELRKNEAWKRAEELRKEAEQRFEEGFVQLLGSLRIASVSELEKLDRKVNQVARKLKEMEKSAPAAA